MAKTSKTVPKKDKTSSSSASRPAKPVVPPTLEKITPGPCIIKKDFSVENPPDFPGQGEHASRYISLISKKLIKDVRRDSDAWVPQAVPDLEDWVRKLAATSSYDERLGDASEMRPAPPRENTKPSNPKSEKDNKRKRVSKTKDPQDKKTPARRLRKRFAQTGADLAHDSLDDEENDGEESGLVTRTRKPIEAAKPSKLETSSCGKGTPKEEEGKAPLSLEVEIVPLSSTTIPEGARGRDNRSLPFFARRRESPEASLRPKGRGA
uniref:Uncharacterized protein LOC104238999 n=1 Tax=Nicotiana sylvestris TaxID=4096 RepID=A0A1U7XQD8_NICSY|nr:PREDICTED: uncharacterized protein LOC104238999 [Nicotiana sylvestris]